MKKLFIFILTTSIFMSVNAQDILKIREVFDYEIGDEFQFTSSTIHYPGEFIPQNADRIKIIGKYYS